MQRKRGEGGREGGEEGVGRREGKDGGGVGRVGCRTPLPSLLIPQPNSTQSVQRWLAINDSFWHVEVTHC